MDTKSRRVKLPTITEKPENCSFDGYDAISLMAETAKLRRLITKRGTLEILIPLCCTTDPVRYMKFRQTLRGISSKTRYSVERTSKRWHSRKASIRRNSAQGRI